MIGSRAFQTNQQGLKKDPIAKLTKKIDNLAAFYKKSKKEDKKAEKIKDKENAKKLKQEQTENKKLQKKIFQLEKQKEKEKTQKPKKASEEQQQKDDSYEMRKEILQQAGMSVGRTVVEKPGEYLGGHVSEEFNQEVSRLTGKSIGEWTGQLTGQFAKLTNLLTKPVISTKEEREKKKEKKASDQERKDISGIAEDISKIHKIQKFTKTASFINMLSNVVQSAFSGASLLKMLGIAGVGAGAVKGIQQLGKLSGSVKDLMSSLDSVAGTSLKATKSAERLFEDLPSRLEKSGASSKTAMEMTKLLQKRRAYALAQQGKSYALNKLGIDITQEIPREKKTFGIFPSGNIQEEIAGQRVQELDKQIALLKKQLEQERKVGIKKKAGVKIFEPPSLHIPGKGHKGFGADIAFTLGGEVETRKVNGKSRIVARFLNSGTYISPNNHKKGKGPGCVFQVNKVTYLEAHNHVIPFSAWQNNDKVTAGDISGYVEDMKNPHQDIKFYKSIDKKWVPLGKEGTVERFGASEIIKDALESNTLEVRGIKEFQAFKGSIESGKIQGISSQNVVQSDKNIKAVSKKMNQSKIVQIPTSIIDESEKEIAKRMPGRMIESNQQGNNITPVVHYNDNGTTINNYNNVVMGEESTMIGL